MYKHLNIVEREMIHAWKESGVSLREIAIKLGRDVSTISRELGKNTKYGKPYVPCYAQRRADRVGERQRYKAPLKGPAIFLYVRQHLRSPYFWTPEMISGRIGRDIKGASINTETIYRYIYSRKNRKDALWQHLPCGRKKRMKKHGRKVHNKGRVPNSKSIDIRPKSVDKRRIPGHWETDNIQGIRTSRPALSVLTDRSFRTVMISKVPNQTAEEKTKAVVGRLKDKPQELLKSITTDNGKENYGHEEVSKTLGLEMYFCHAYHSWEKGTVENRNKQIRRFLPKGTDSTHVTKHQIQAVERVINNMPLKCLGYLTPYEKMDAYLEKIKST